MAATDADRPPHALVVEGNAIIRIEASEILEDAGFRTHEANRAGQALAILGEHHASTALLFTSVGLPGDENGFHLAREAARCWPHIGILVASGSYVPAPGDLPEGAVFIDKPFSAALVRARLKELLPDEVKPDPLKG